MLDGVDKEEQIKALAGKLTEFGPGSRIIMATNKRNVLKASTSEQRKNTRLNQWIKAMFINSFVSMLFTSLL